MALGKRMTHQSKIVAGTRNIHSRDQARPAPSSPRIHVCIVYLGLLDGFRVFQEPFIYGIGEAAGILGASGTKAKRRFVYTVWDDLSFISPSIKSLNVYHKFAPHVTKYGVRDSSEES